MKFLEKMTKRAVFLSSKEIPNLKIERIESTKMSYGARLLYKDNLKYPITIKLDFSLRENVLQPTKNILETDYPVIMQSFIHSLSLDEILAEKIRAVLKRKKHRDLYDLWILQELGAEIDIELINKKLDYYNEKFEVGELKERLKLFSKDGFIKDLRPFVPINERDKLGELFEFVLAYLEKSI